MSVIQSPPVGSKLRESVLLSLAIISWIVAIGFGWWMLAAYEFRREPTDPAGPIGRWPANTSLKLAADRPTVLFFMHPKCPCTRASLAEMERLWVTEQLGKLNSPQLIVVATVPANAGDDWTATDTVNRAKEFPGADLVIDVEGREAERFGATTSGTVMWFDTVGCRLYAGGITASRGHEGDNAGRSTLEALLDGNPKNVTGLPVFGCRLCMPEKSGKVSGQ